VFEVMLALVSWRHVLPGLSSKFALTKESEEMSDSFFLWLILFLWLIGIAIAQAAEKTTKVVKKIAENEGVQEAGKGLLARWLESMLRK
jgi:hypothetical protein